MQLGGGHNRSAIRVCFINRFYFPDESATAQLLADLCRDLSRAGFHVEVVTSRQRYNNPRADLSPFEVTDGVAIHRVGTAQFGRARLLGRLIDYASFYLSCAVKLFAVIRSGDIVVAKTDPPLLSVLAAVVCGVKRAKLVNWIQDVFPEIAQELKVPLVRGPSGWVLRGLRNASLRRAIVNVALGTRMKELLKAECGPSATIDVIHNWADGDEIAPNCAYGVLRQTLHLSDEFVVMYSGNMGRVHEFQTALLAAEALKKRRDIVFLFVGQGNRQAELQDLAAAKGLDNVRFLPPQSRDMLSGLLSVGDVHLVTLLPALEGLVVPSKFYGIVAAGRPVLFVGDPDGEVARMVRLHDCGACAKVGDWNELVGHIVRLERDRALTRQAGERGRAAFLKHYDRRIAVGEWIRLLRCASGCRVAE